MLKIEHLWFSYKKRRIFQSFSLSLEKGELLAVMGPSGCGKSTLLNLIAGLRTPTVGSVQINTAHIAYVFQEPRLFPWLTVEQNLAAVLPNPKTGADRIDEALALVGLSDAKKLYPKELSGGMKIRVSLARALVRGGELFLLDEPFSALDEELRAHLVADLRNYFKKNGISAILVTHQSTDAAGFADRILHMEPLAPQE